MSQKIISSYVFTIQFVRKEDGSPLLTIRRELPVPGMQMATILGALVMEVDVMKNNMISHQIPLIDPKLEEELEDEKNKVADLQMGLLNAGLDWKDGKIVKAVKK